MATVAVSADVLQAIAQTQQMMAELLNKKNTSSYDGKSFSQIIGSAPFFNSTDSKWAEFSYKTRSWMEAHFPKMAKEIMRWTETQNGEVREAQAKSQCATDDVYEEMKMVQAKLKYMLDTNTTGEHLTLLRLYQHLRTFLALKPGGFCAAATSQEELARREHC
jgi:hypothetical protein